MTKTTKINDSFFLLILLLFVGIVMVDPTNKLFHLKEIVFVLLILVTIVLQKGKFYKDVMISYSSLSLLAILSVCFGKIFFQSDLLGTVSYFKALLFGIVAYSLSKLSINEIVYLNYWVGLGLSAFISLMLLAFVGGFFDMSGVIDKMSDTQTVMMAKRDLLGMDTLMFFYKTMPFCFFGLVYALREKKWWAVILLLAPIVYGGSRTPMLMALVTIGYILYERKNKFLRIFIGFISAIALLYLVHTLTSGENVQSGDELKAGSSTYLISQSLPIGRGVGAAYFDAGRNKLTTNSEMTYFEMLYQYGWILFPFVLYIFVKPIFVMYKKINDVHVKDFAVAYLLYLVNAGTNPLLISSTGMYVFACALTIAAKVREDNKRKAISRIINVKPERVV